MKNHLITIVTPTYNRANLLPRLFDSLKNQTSMDFVWLIIDDGSSDETEKLVNSTFKAQNSKFSILYIKKENGGKHTALNIAFERVETELLFIVDSDDILTNDAIETIENDYKALEAGIYENPNGRELCGISYLRGYSTDKVIGDTFPKDHAIDNYIELRMNKFVMGDKAEVWVTRFLKNYRYPEYPGERFISEALAWCSLAKKYDMLFVNKIIYITEYLPGGLSDSGRKLRFKCPLSSIDASVMCMSKECSLTIRLKETLLYIVYSIFAHHNLKQILNIKYKKLVAVGLIPGTMLYFYWYFKYKMWK